MTGTGPPAALTDRILLRVLPDVADYINENCATGGIFAHPGHGLERCISVLRLELEAVQAHCKTNRQRFDAEAFWRIYAADLAATTPGKAGRPPKDHAQSVARQRLSGNLAVEILDWARATLVDAGPFETMSQVAEVSVRRFRARQAPPFDVQALLAEYEGNRR